MFSFDALADTLKQHSIDAYLAYDFRGSNHLARGFFNFQGHTTRRWVVIVRSDRTVISLIPRLEQGHCSTLPGEKIPYSSYEEFHSLLTLHLQGVSVLALDRSVENELPILDLTPSGVEALLKKLLPTVTLTSIAPYTQKVLSQWGEEGLMTHKDAAQKLFHIKERLYTHLAACLSSGKTLTEWEATLFVQEEFKKEGFLSEGLGSIIAVNAHAGDPHYAPSPTVSAVIAPNSVLLVDLWGKTAQHGIFADVTFMAWVGTGTIPSLYQKVWNCVRDARNRGRDLLMEKSVTLQGWQIDREVRDVITAQGFGDSFIHRTGHSLARVDHGPGANLDDFETHDTRPLLPDTGYTIEPGIYLSELGVRSEIDLYVSSDGTVEVTTWEQEEIEKIG